MVLFLMGRFTGYCNFVVVMKLSGLKAVVFQIINQYYLQAESDP